MYIYMCIYMYTEMDMYSIWMFVSICWRTDDFMSLPRFVAGSLWGTSSRRALDVLQWTLGIQQRFQRLMVWPNKATAVSISLYCEQFAYLATKEEQKFQLCLLPTSYRPHATKTSRDLFQRSFALDVPLFHILSFLLVQPVTLRCLRGLQLLCSHPAKPDQPSALLPWRCRNLSFFQTCFTCLVFLTWSFFSFCIRSKCFFPKVTFSHAKI